MTQPTEFDFIVIGAGSAGCVLVERLSANPNHQVCLLEAGGSDKSPLVQHPLGIIQLIKSKTYNWLFETQPEANAQGRNIFCPRGKVLGGSSSINAMIYIRGQAEDYDEWAKLGNTDWSYAKVLPYFKQLQRQIRGASEYHGTDGPLWVSDSTSDMPLNSLFLQACEQLGLPVNEDFNGETQEGCGTYQFTMKNGKRCSAADAFLRPAMGRPNLNVSTHFKVAKILFEGKRAIGVEGYKNGKLCRLTARKEVILSAGALQSPQLLLLSGVGAKNALEKHNIKVVHELLGVGENLQEHVDIINVIKINRPLSIALRPMFFIKLIPEILKYWRKKRGFFTSSVVEVGGFVRSDESHSRPNLQLQFSPLAHDDHGRNLRFLLQYGVSLHSCLLRPKSRGNVQLKSANYQEAPAISLNILSHPSDMQQMIQAVRLNRQILSQAPFKNITRQEILPLPAVESDEQIADFIREKANHVYHPVGTCKMGSDSMAVVDSQLKVHGMQGLRVVDASIMPTLVSGNTNAPCMMIAAKAADMILACYES